MNIENDKELIQHVQEYANQFEPRFRKAAIKAYIDGIAFGFNAAKDKINEIWEQS